MLLIVMILLAVASLVLGVCNVALGDTSVGVALIMIAFLLQRVCILKWNAEKMPKRVRIGVYPGQGLCKGLLIPDCHINLHDLSLVQVLQHLSYLERLVGRPLRLVDATVLAAEIRAVREGRIEPTVVMVPIFPEEYCFLLAKKAEEMEVYLGKQIEGYDTLFA